MSSSGYEPTLQPTPVPVRRIAIVGGGIAGLAAAYEMEKRRRNGSAIEWTLFEATDRLGGIVETVHRGGFVIECGPEAWVTEKPWARELAQELGLSGQIIPSNDADRKTYIVERSGETARLLPMPDGMRMMVPADLSALEGSELFSEEARAAYAAEPGRAAEFKEIIPQHDESVASFVGRHFGDEVLDKVGAPLLSGVFGGDVAKLSVRAVMPGFVAMEREHGSLINAVRAAAEKRNGQPAAAVFTTLRSGLGTLIEVLSIALPTASVLRSTRVTGLVREEQSWSLTTLDSAGVTHTAAYDEVMLAAPVDVQRTLLTGIDAEAAALLPTDASSAVIVALGWNATQAAGWTIPPGFGLLVPQQDGRALAEAAIAQTASQNEAQHAAADDHHAASLVESTRLLAATFVDQKFPSRTPPGARLIRVFFGGRSAEAFASLDDQQVSAIAALELRRVLGQPGIPASDPALTVVRRWPRSLPQYEVGHLERMEQLDQRIAALPGLTLLGNGYRGVGLPDLVRDARAAARTACDAAPNVQTN